MAGFSKASYRNVDFLVESISGKFGQRSVIHEYPDKDIPASETLGRQAQGFSFDGLFVGDDVEEQARALRDAYHKKGPAMLDHPTFGQIMVVAIKDGLDIRQTTERRKITFSIQFTEAGEDLNPSVSDDHGYLVSTAAGDLLASSKEAFAEKFSILGKADFVTKSATAKIEGYADSLSKTNLGGAEGFNTAASFFDSIKNIKAKASGLAGEPSSLADRLDDLNKMAGNSFNVSGSASTSVYRNQFNSGDDDKLVRISTPNRDQENQNTLAFNKFIQEMALSNAAIQASQTEFESIQDALEMRDVLVAQIDKLSQDPSSDDVYLGLLDLRSKVLGGIPKDDVNIGTVFKYKTTSVTNPMLVCYSLLGSVASVDDLIARNKLRNPSFISANETLEVLSGNRRRN